MTKLEREWVLLGRKGAQIALEAVLFLVELAILAGASLRHLAGFK